MKPYYNIEAILSDKKVGEVQFLNEPKVEYQPKKNK